VDIVRRYVELKRAGTGSWKGLCPFHAEKTPSFNVHEQRQYFHCFGCGEKGDVFSFLVKIEQRSVHGGAARVGPSGWGGTCPKSSSLPPNDRPPPRRNPSASACFRVMDAATSFFEAQLAGSAGGASRAYLEKRGISSAVRARFRLGYAPPAWDALQKHLALLQVPGTVAEQLGLVGANERGRYDFFRDRVMLPVFDRQKRPIGFFVALARPRGQGTQVRELAGLALFHKKENLYGLHVAMDAIRRSGTAIVVEGNFDVLSLHEAGIEEAVAPMGTALTGEQVKLLSRAAKRMVVVFDGDAAGARAAEKAIPVAVEAGLFFAEADADGRVAQNAGRG